MENLDKSIATPDVLAEAILALHGRTVRVVFCGDLLKKNPNFHIDGRLMKFDSQTFMVEVAEGRAGLLFQTALVSFVECGSGRLTALIGIVA